MCEHNTMGSDEVIDLDAVSEETRGIPDFMHEESPSEIDYRE